MTESYANGPADVDALGEYLSRRTVIILLLYSVNIACIVDCIIDL